MLRNVSLVFVGAGAGGVLRYLMALALNPLLAEIPLGTLSANVLGSGAAGALIGFLGERTALDPTLRPLLLAGFLGGLTTFSSFSVEVVRMLEAGAVIAVDGTKVPVGIDSICVHGDTPGRSRSPARCERPSHGPASAYAPSPRDWRKVAGIRSGRPVSHGRRGGIGGRVRHRN